jgi:hypothetical protein
VPRIPIAIASTAFIAVVVGTTAFLIGDPVESRSASALVAIGLLAIALTGLAGLLLARAPWGRWTLAAAVVTALALASLSAGVGAWISDVVGAVALVGLFGPWLRLWTRHHRVADGPGPVPVFLMWAGVSAPFVVGCASVTDGVAPASWFLVAGTSLGAGLYARGVRSGLWMLRLLPAPLALWAGVATGGIGGPVIIGAATAVTVAAWLPAARRTTTVITPVLPEPVRRT